MKAIKQLEKILNEGFIKGAYPGATYAISFKDKIYVGSIGHKAIVPEKEDNSIDTIYDLASVSKVLSTVTCILVLVERGQIRLFDRVNRYIPEYRHENIRIYDLLTHTSGMASYLQNVSKIKSSQEAWNQIMALDLVYETGSKISYSCLNYIILGKIIERVSGKTLDKFATEVIFEPLTMTSTSYNPVDIKRCAPTENRQDEIHQGILRGKVHDELAYILDGISGNAGVFSTANDVGKFMQMILNNGCYQGKQILSKASIDLIYTPQVEEHHGVYIKEEIRSLGWIIKGSASSAGELASDETILHTGFTGTNLWIDRQNEVGFCLLTNRVHPTRNNGLHIEYRPKVANFLIANLTKIKGEI